ncbi:MAG: nucleotidyltransferase family protein [Acidobacteriota bacterium]|nr:nucleotidyltransferase family protein [Acidobacteriota bacterium]
MLGRRFLASARREGTAPLLERHLRRRPDLVPAAVLAELRGIRLAAAARDLRARGIMRPLLETAFFAGLKVGISKGFHWAERLYDEPGLRPYLDVDVFVRPAEWRSFLEILRRTGFRPDGTRDFDSVPGLRAPAWTFSPVFRKDGLAVEIHPNPFGLQSPSPADEDFWRSLRPVSLAGTTAYVPAWPQEFCYAAIHAQQHSYGRLSWLVDMAEMAGLSEWNWDTVAGLARRAGIEASLEHGLRIVSRCWPGAIPEPGRRLIPDGGWARRTARFFWPEEAAAARRPIPEAPYYMPTLLALTRRGRLGPKVRTLGRILCPPRDWIRSQMPGAGPLARTGYAVGRLARPWIYLVRRRIGG